MTFVRTLPRSTTRARYKLVAQRLRIARRRYQRAYLRDGLTVYIPGADEVCGPSQKGSGK